MTYKPKTTTQKLWNLMAFQVNARLIKSTDFIEHLDFFTFLSLLGKAPMSQKAYWLKRLKNTWKIL